MVMSRSRSGSSIPFETTVTLVTGIWMEPNMSRSELQLPVCAAFRASNNRHFTPTTIRFNFMQRRTMGFQSPVFL